MHTFGIEVTVVLDLSRDIKELLMISLKLLGMDHGTFSDSNKRVVCITKLRIGSITEVIDPDHTRPSLSFRCS